MATKSTSQWQRFIRTTAEDTSHVIFTHHVLKRMRERYITQEMALNVLRKGVIRRTPEPNLIKGTLECRMDYFIAGRDIGVVVAVDDSQPDLIVITAMEL